MSSERQVALLRSINVGGTKKVPMAELRALCEGLGWSEVKTYIASGNVLFTPPLGAEAPALAGDLAEAVRGHFGFEVPVVVRSAAGLRAALEEVPFSGADVDDKLLHVVFLDGVPAPERVAALDPDRSPGDRFAVVGDRLYVRYGTGAGSTKLTLGWFEKQLDVAGTARNWRTVGKLVELTGA